MIHNEEQFNSFINDALAQGFSGWDFSYIEERRTIEDLSWDYAQEVRNQMNTARAMLDMGTGGGEFLASLAPFPEKTYATEAWELNVPIASECLEPLGVEVYEITDKHNLPFENNTFDLIINRHEAFSGVDIHRMLKPGGVFIAQMVGGANNIRFNELLAAPPPEFGYITLDDTVQELQNAGLEIVKTEECFPEERYFDIGAIVFHLSVIKWQIEDFTVAKYRQKLGELHNMIQRDGYLATSAHRILIKARRKNS